MSIDSKDPLAAIRQSLGEDEPSEEQRRDFLHQAMIYAEEIRTLHESEKRRADELEAAKTALEIAISKVKQAERSREEFIANCSHELRTPLTPIIGWAQYLKKREAPSEEVKELAEVIERHGLRLNKIVDSLLRVAMIRYDESRTKSKERVDIAAVIAKAATIARNAGRPVEEDVKPAAEFAMTVESDLSDILSYLVDNAVKFTNDESAIRLEVRNDEDRVIFSVIDSGPGVPKSDRERIFTSFVQGDGSETRQHGGLGVGLFIARELVRALGGNIWVEETPGGGATFRFTIPNKS